MTGSRPNSAQTKLRTQVTSPQKLSKWKNRPPEPAAIAMIDSGILRPGCATPHVTKPMAAAVAPMTGSGSPCVVMAYARRPRAATPHRMARTFLLGMSLGGSVEGYFLSETAFASFNSLSEAFWGSIDRRNGVREHLDGDARGDLHLGHAVVHLDQLAQQARGRDDLVALLERGARRLLLLLPAGHEQEEGHEDDEHHQERHEAAQRRRRRGRASAGGAGRLRGVHGDSGGTGLRRDVLGEELVVREQGGGHFGSEKTRLGVGGGGPDAGRRDSPWGLSSQPLGTNSAGHPKQDPPEGGTWTLCDPCRGHHPSPRGRRPTR